MLGIGFRRYPIQWIAAAALVLLTVVAVGWFLAARGSEAGFRAATSARPNIIIITTDDQAATTFTREIMPRAFEDLVDRGVRFTNSIAAPPLCCPYRAGLISGRYDHNNGVRRNRPGYSDLIEPEMVLPRFLQEVGYRTGFVGKYLNGTAAALGPKPAPGWDRWFAMVDSPSYYGATISDGGEVRDLPRKVETTSTLNRVARQFVDEAAGPKPFFLWLAHFAPHPDRKGDGVCSGASVAKADVTDFRAVGDAQMPQTPDLTETDRSDKPKLIRERGPATPAELAFEERAWKCAGASLQAVDRGIDLLIDQLERSGVAERTIIVFGSDNGMNYGHHGLVGKLGIYEQMLQVPMVIRPVQATKAEVEPVESDELVSQVDLMPTLLDLAGAEPCLDDECVRMDGRSLGPLLLGGSGEWPTDRAIPVRLGDCRISAYRTPTRLFGRYLDPEPTCREESIETYDLRQDPYELENAATRENEFTDRLRKRLFQIQHCTGIEGRDPPPEEGQFYCE